MQDASLDNIDLCGKRINFDTKFARGFVDQVDGFVWQEPICEVAIRQHRSTYKCSVLNAHTMVNFVAFLQTTQNRDRCLDGGLTHIHLLKTALECRVFLHVLAILIERRGADHAKFTSSEHRLDHVSCIHRTFSTARPDKCVQFVNECDDLTLSIGDFFQHCLQAFLELTAVLCTCQH